MDKKKIHMIGNTHIDPVWLWNRAEGMQEVKSSFTSALDRMDEFPDFIFTQSSISFLEWIKDNCPEQFQRIIQRVAEGRWEIVGGMWVEPDCDLSSGESLIRHFLYGKKFVRDNFNKDVLTTYNVDSFGHGSNLPAICNGCGVKYYLMSRPDKKHVELPPVFVWKSMDGSQVIAERTGGEYMAWTRPSLEFNLSESLDALEEYGYDRMAVFYGVGNHGGGPTIENIRTIYEMREEYTELELDFSTMEDFFSKVEVDKIPERMQEMGRIFFGCYSSDKKIKELNRLSEWTLLKAEAITCMAANMGIKTYEYPKMTIESAWKETLFNQFHDILAGTSIEPARNEACQEFESSIAAGRKLICNGIQAIVNQLDTRGDGFPLILINPCGSSYKGVYAANVYVPRALKRPLRIRNCKGIEISYSETDYKNSVPESRKGILFEAEVPAFGYTIYRIITEGPDNTPEENYLGVKKHWMDNGILKIKFDEITGCPSSIQKDGEELLESPCTFSVYYDDRGAWGEDIYKEQLQGEFKVTDCKVVEANGMRIILRYLLEYEKSEIMADYILEKGSDKLKLSIKLRNGEKHRQITLDIPVKAKNPLVWTETAFLAENKVNCKDSNTEHYQHRFADITEENKGGIAVINNSIYGFRQVENVYKLILLRNSVFARGKGGPLPENLEGSFMNQGTYDYELVLLPHTRELKKQRLFEEADFLHMPVEYIGDSCHIGGNWERNAALLNLELENVKVSALKKGEGTEETIVLRLFETEGLMGAAMVKCHGETVNIEFAPYEIKTLRLSKKGWMECSMLDYM